jgi:hypothetical protein
VEVYAVDPVPEVLVRCDRFAERIPSGVYALSDKADQD